MTTAPDIHPPRWLSIVGIGEDGLDALSPAARALVEAAEVLIGGDRHLAMLPPDGRERLSWPSPLSALVERIDGLRPRQVCVLATGDPMCFGIGTTLARRVPLAEMTILPAPGAFALACARLGWPAETTRQITLHGRPVALLHAHVQPGARLLILSDGADTPRAVAQALSQRGWEPSRLTVLEHLGGPSERLVTGTAGGWAHDDLADLNTLAVECLPGSDAVLLPRTPGLPDDAFEHDGQMTKRETRAATLAALQPVPGQLLWDIGAGCGSVAIEWMRTDPLCRAVAVERKESRLGMLARNAEALGTPLLKIVRSAAPAALDGLEPPDAVFIGGGVSADGLLERCWQALKPGGRLVANVVTLDGEARLFDWQAREGGDLTRLAVSRAETVGPYRGWRPLMTVTQYRAHKPW